MRSGKILMGLHHSSWIRAVIEVAQPRGYAIDNAISVEDMARKEKRHGPYTHYVVSAEFLLAGRDERDLVLYANRLCRESRERGSSILFPTQVTRNHQILVSNGLNAVAFDPLDPAPLDDFLQIRAPKDTQ
jgi:hypothetical protein